jgi:Ca-activated chloride channel family protein
MKLSHLAVWSLSGMLLSCTTVYAVVPPPLERAHAAMRPEASTATPTDDAASDSAALALETRVGHERLRADGSRHTYLMLEMRVPSAARAAKIVPSNTALVLDRSGSMEGQAMANAKTAANAWIERTADGDRLSVVAFDSDVQRLMAPTAMNSETRKAAIDAVSRLGLGGSTCISCGIEEVMTQFSPDDTSLQRIVVLSDGEANRGIVSMPGFAELAERCRERGVSVTTVGLGTSYNEKVLSLLSFESNGRHHFAADPEALAPLFVAESDVLRSTVATAVEAQVRLAPGVELVRVADRAHSTKGAGEVAVPLGSFAAGASKTVLLEVIAPRDVGRRDLADVELRWFSHDAGMQTVKRSLSVEVHPRDESELDPLVGMRLDRGRTASVLREASSAFAEGRRDEALELLQRHDAMLQDSARELKHRAKAKGDARAADISGDLNRQLEATRKSRSMFRAAPKSPPGRRAAKRAMETANPWME